jgi:rod shape-determining protein MreC
MLRRSLKPIVTSGGVLLLLIFLHQLTILKPVEQLLLRAFKPVLALSYNTGSRLRNAWSAQTDRRDWQMEAGKLRDQVNALTNENAHLKQLEDENTDLRNQLHFVDSKKKKFVLANIISDGDANLVNQEITLDKGSREGLFTGLAVTSGSGQVVGKILNVDSETAKICLINQTDCQFAGAVQNENRTSGIVHGDLGLTIKMEFIPQSENIKVGQIIVTSGLEKNVSRGQVLGQIAEVQKENNALWQSAKIESLIDLNSLITVSIVLP